MRKAVAVILIVLMIVGIFQPSFYHYAYGATISDPKDINPPAGAKLTVGNSTAWYSAGFWKVYVDGKLVGEDLCIVDDLKLSQTGNLWNMLHKNTINAWLDAFTPAPSPTGYYSGATFSKKLGSYDPYYIKTITYGGKTSQRLHIREAGKLAGVASITYDENKKEVYVQTTQFPTGGISFPSGVKEGDKINFQIRGTAYANIQAKTVTYEFYIDGKMAASNTLSKTTFNETVTKTLTAGTHSLVLKVTDGVGRTTTYTKSITVQPGSPPPPPPGSIQAGIRLDLDPSSLKVGTTGNVNATIDASSSVSSGSGPYSARFWLQVNGVDLLGKDGTAITGLTSLSQAKYEKLISNAKPGDKVWAKVRVWDASINKTAEAETERVIMEEGEELPNPEPPPVDPPEPPPVPEPPVARFIMPSEMGVGRKVKIINNSYDPDGPELYGITIDCQWEISPYNNVDDTELKPAGGYVVFNQPGVYTVTLTVTDIDGLSDTTSKNITITNKPPVARIQAPDEVIQGDEVNIYSDSYDPDGNLDTVEWTISPNEDIVGTLSSEENKLIFNKPGNYEITLTAKDTCGLSDTAKKTIIVKPAIPEAYFSYSGVPKQNRKLVLDSSGSVSSPNFPVDFSKNEWEFVPAEGATVADIKVVSSTDLKTRQVLFKKPGEYKIRLRVTNTAGNTSEWYEQTLKIYPDDPPIADFFVMATVLRDPENDNKAKIELIDSSYSPDGDYISQRIWRYKYDSDNDGSFDDESWVTLDNGNNTNPVLYTNQVGKYLFELTVKEGYGEETIPEFITSADYRQADTSAKPTNDKVSEVVNLRPTVDFEAIVKPQIDLSIIGVTNNTGLASTINSQSNTLIAGLSNKGFSVRNTVSVLTEDKEAKIEEHGYIYFNTSRYPYDIEYITVRNYDYINHIGDFGRVLKYTTAPGPDNFHELRIYVEYYQKVPESQDYPNAEPKVSYSVDGNTWHNLTLTYTGYYRTWKNVGSGEYSAKSFEFRSDYIRGDIRYIRVRGASNGVTDYIVRTYAYAFGNTEINVPVKLNDDKFLSAISSQTWRDTSSKYVIVISDSEADFDDLQGIIDRYNEENIKAIVVGTSDLKSVGQKITDGTGGAFFEFDGTNIPWDHIEDYLSQELQKKRVITQTILIGEEIEYKKYYLDPENDPKFSERWLYTHDPTYFENSIGVADFSGEYLSAPVKSFDKVGKYDVIFQARDNPKSDNRFDNYRLWSYMPLNKLVLYVHRKPIALFTANLTPVGTSSQTIIEDFEDTNYEFSFSGNWGRSTAQRYAGQYSYKSASIGPNSTTSTQFTYTIPSGVTNAKISFYYLVRSEANFDFFNFYVNGNRLIHDSGYGSWKYFSYSLTSGTTYTFTFEYTKDGSVSSYDDAAYIDNVTIQYDGVITSYNVQLSSTSYDLDHQSEPGKGIVEEEWKWKETTATSWNSGKPSTLGVNKTYLVWLRVKDKEGAWSDPYVSVLSTMQVNLAPIAMFTVDPNTQVVNKTISISDMSYDPNGDPIAERSWRVQKPDGTWINYGSTPPTNIPSLGVGTYTIELKVRDNPQFGTPLWSEAYTQQVTVIPDNNKPVARFTIGPNPVVADEPYTLNDTSYDPDNDPIVAREWRVQKPDGTWVTITQWKPTFEEMGLGDDGTYRIQLRVLDDPSRRHPALTPMWSDPYTVTVQVQGRLIVIGSSNKTTYKAGEAMILYARTEGKAYRVEAKMWYPNNEFTSSNVTTLVPDTPLTSPPQDVMTWHTKHTKAEGRDVVVIIPKDMPDGNYQVVFTAYKQLAGGGTKTATDTITVRVKGTIYDHSKSQIIGPRF